MLKKLSERKKVKSGVQEDQEKWFCRWAPSLGKLEGTALEAWGTLPYNYWKHKYRNLIQFGAYDLRDYLAIYRHRGKVWILWAGSDIRNLRANFIFNDGKLLWLSQLFSKFGGGIFRDFLIRNVLRKAEHWVENEAEAWQLKDIGIKVTGICPSFMGRIKDYKVSFKQGNKVYVSASEGRQDEYGWGLVCMIACSLPEIEFHLYGADWDHQPLANVFVHGRISKKKMNQQIKKMQCGLRLNKHDGFSEITAKSVLWGQYPITYLYNPMIDQYTKDDCGQPWCVEGLNNLIKLLKNLPKKKKPNIKARTYYVDKLNKYPWSVK